MHGLKSCAMFFMLVLSLQNSSDADERYSKLRQSISTGVEAGYFGGDNAVCGEGYVGDTDDRDGVLHWNLGSPFEAPDVAPVRSQYIVERIRRYGMRGVFDDQREEGKAFWEPYLARVEVVIEEELSQYGPDRQPSRQATQVFFNRKFAIYQEAMERLASKQGLRQKWGTQKEVFEAIRAASAASRIEVTLYSASRQGNIKWMTAGDFDCMSVLGVNTIRYQTIGQGMKRTVVPRARYAYYVEKTAGAAPPAIPLFIDVEPNGEDLILPE